MTKFHINANGDAGPCTASVRACQFGEADHFDKIGIAQMTVERRLAETHGVTAPPLKKFREKIIKALLAVEAFAESVDANHDRNMEEIRDLDRQQRINKAAKR